MSLTVNEERLLVELAANAGRMLTCEHLPRRVWGSEGDADDPPYTFNELRVGYRMANGEAEGPLNS